MKASTARASPLARLSVVKAMHPGIVACTPTTPLPTVARMMTGHDVHAVVVRNGSSGRGWAIVRDVDVLEAALAGKLEGHVASEIASPLATVRSDSRLDLVAARMLRLDCRHLLVLDADTGHSVGILSTLDVVAALVGAVVAGPPRATSRESW